MTWLPLLLDQEPDFAAIEAAFPFAAAMAATPQDPVFHAEGDVWTHTCMVVQALLDRPDFRALPDERRHALMLAAWLHDMAKPRTTVVEWDATLGRERIRQPGHARLGARMAWHALWLAGADRALRERVYWLCAWHQRPFHMWQSGDMLRNAITFAAVGRWRDLVILAQADHEGRIAPERTQGAEALDLLALWLEEQGLIDASWPFANPESRIVYLARPDRSPWYAARPAEGSRVVLLSGLPGAGKDRYAAATFPDLPQVSLDRLREDLEVEPDEAQGPVVQAACEEARRHLRAGAPFVWNATNLTRAVRARVIGLCLAYDAHVVVHCLDRPLQTVLRQNRARSAAVPEHVVGRLAQKWEPASELEAHAVVWT